METDQVGLVLAKLDNRKLMSGDLEGYCGAIFHFEHYGKLTVFISENYPGNYKLVCEVHFELALKCNWHPIHEKTSIS